MYAILLFIYLSGFGDWFVRIIITLIYKSIRLLFILTVILLLCEMSTKSALENGKGNKKNLRSAVAEIIPPEHLEGNDPSESLISLSPSETSSKKKKRKKSKETENAEEGRSSAAGVSALESEESANLADRFSTVASPTRPVSPSNSEEDDDLGTQSGPSFTAEDKLAQSMRRVRELEEAVGRAGP